MPDFDNQHNELVVVNFVDNAIVTDPNTPLVMSFDFPGATWTRIVAKRFGSGDIRRAAMLSMRSRRLLARFAKMTLYAKACSYFL